MDIGEPMVIRLPRGATGATALEGSSMAASVSETQITITGPLPSGTTMVQAAYRMPYSSSEVTLTQQWPAALPQVIVGVQKIGDLRVSSPQLTETSDVRTDNGDLFVLGNGPALPAGGTVTITLSGLPFHSPTPRYVTLALAGAVIALGVWLAFRGQSKTEDTRQTLVARRDTLLAQLAQMESKRRAGVPEADGQIKRRTRIISELEQIYGELDDAHPEPQGGGEGVAA